MKKLTFKVFIMLVVELFASSVTDEMNDCIGSVLAACLNVSPDEVKKS